MRQPASVRLLAVDPHELITWGLRTVLTQQPWVERCLQATDLTQAGVLAARYTPHVILVDGSLADGGDSATLQHASPSSRLARDDRAPGPCPQRLLQTLRACGFVSQVVGHRGDRRRRAPRRASGSASRRRSCRATRPT